MSPPIAFHGLLVLIVDAFILAVVVLKPFSRNYDDSDQGSGNVVDLPAPLRPSYRRCATFLFISFVVSVLLVGLRSPHLVQAYHDLVAWLLVSVVPDPALVRQYADSLPPVFQIGVVSFGVAFALVFRATVARRLMILAHVGLFLMVSAVVDAFFGLFVLYTHFPLGPTPLLNMLVQYCVTGTILVRLNFTTFQLPNKTPLPLRRGHDWKNDFVLVACVGASIVGIGYAATMIIKHFGSTGVVGAAVLYACPPYLFLAMTVSMGIVRLLTKKSVNPTSVRPPIEVIIPAYNEEVVISVLLESIDRAAGVYGGPVRVLLCDDGSTDDTIPVARAVMEAYQHATGEILRGEHGGKSAALNLALAECRCDIVVRVDADCEVHPNAFLYAVPYFLDDPEVGLVSAFTLPKEPYTTWIDRMRLFEVIVLYGLNRPACDLVDGLYCVPGTFTAFLRRPALEVGGFIEGMYGEDAEFTYAMTRLGYRVVTDTRIANYEDVPNTVRQLRIQRTRWDRGGAMCFSRNIPVVTGLAGPRSWFYALRRAQSLALMPFRLTLLVYLVAQALIHPTVRVNLALIGLVLLLRAVPALLLTITTSWYYGRARHLLWIPLQPVFVTLKHYYALEAMLSFNARPLISNRVARALRPAPEIPAPEMPAREMVEAIDGAEAY